MALIMPSSRMLLSILLKDRLMLSLFFLVLSIGIVGLELRIAEVFQGFLAALMSETLVINFVIIN